MTEAIPPSFPQLVPGDEIMAAIEHAEALARAGVRLFLAPPAVDETGAWDYAGGTNGCGYRLPRWGAAVADPAVARSWRRGMALCAVMDGPVNALDVDPRAGGDDSAQELRAAGAWPRVYGRQSTPSGGHHDLVASLGVHSRDGVMPGLDVKAGDDTGGAGFVFLAPTVKVSKETQLVAPYRWIEPPDLDALSEWSDADDSGAAIASRIAALRAPTAEVDPTPHEAWDALDEPTQGKVTAYLAATVRAIGEELTTAASWAEGQRDERGRGWQKIVADACNRLGRLARADWTPWGLEDAWTHLREIVPAIVAREVGLEHTWTAQRNRRPPAIWPEILDRPLLGLVDGGATAADLAVSSPRQENTWTAPAPTPSSASRPHSSASPSTQSPITRASDTSTAHSASGTTSSSTPTDALGSSASGAGCAVTPADADDLAEAEIRFNQLVSDQLYHLRVTERARDLLRIEKTPPAPPFDAAWLAELAERPPEPPGRVEGLIPWEASTLVVAKRKTGKTTLMLNIARCLATGEDLLDRFPVRPVDGVIALLNFEVSAGQIGRWAVDAGIPEGKLFVVNLRGRRNPFGNPEDLAHLTDILTTVNAETLIVDPFGRAYSGQSQNDNGEVGQWLVALDAFARADVGAKDVILATHAGWDGERTRGASALEDWPDSIITMTSEEDDEGSVRRYLSALGRDIDIDEDEVIMDPITRLLRLTGGGSRQQRKRMGDVAKLAVLTVRAATQRPGCSKAEAMESIRAMDDSPGFGKNRDRSMTEAIKLARESGQLRVEGGLPGRPQRLWAVTEL